MAIDYLSDQTTVLSNLSLTGTMAGAAVSNTSATFSGRVAIGGGTPIVFVSGSSVSLVATTATATKSTTTTFAYQLAALGDIVTLGMGGSASSLSPGLVLHGRVSAASTIELTLSNVSAANAAQPAISVTFALTRLVW